jgi:hypothetical protein
MSYSQSSRREDIKSSYRPVFEERRHQESYSLASKERRHKKFAASLKARSYSLAFKERRHQ